MYYDSMHIKFWIKHRGFGIFIKRCDECGEFNPPALYGNERLCAACAKPDGFYKDREKGPLGANGKINYWKLQFPITISWRRWWTMF